MADLSPEQQDYAAIELLYSEGRWDEVVQRSEVLLAALPPQQHALQARLNLVIGHALLYGLGDRPGAERRYRAVQQDVGEPVLREIADQGIRRCREPLPQPEATAQPTAVAMPWDPQPATSAAVVEDVESGRGAAMPWLADLAAAGGGTPPEPHQERLAEPEPEPEPESVADTLSLLRRPDVLLPVTVEVLDEEQQPAATTSEAEPPRFSPDELAELKRGLLEVELR
jgi:hypothetical protein